MKMPIWCDSKFKQNLFSKNQSQNYVDFLTLYDRSFKYKHIREIFVPLFGMLFKTLVCLWALGRNDKMIDSILESGTWLANCPFANDLCVFPRGLQMLTVLFENVFSCAVFL